MHSLLPGIRSFCSAASAVRERQQAWHDEGVEATLGRPTRRIVHHDVREQTAKSVDLSGETTG
jgi:hypothetical protein